MSKKYKVNDINLVNVLKTSETEKTFEAAREWCVVYRGSEISADFPSEVMPVSRQWSRTFKVLHTPSKNGAERKTFSDTPRVNKPITARAVPPEMLNSLRWKENGHEWQSSSTQRSPHQKW